MTKKTISNMRLWAKELRGGKYKQAQGRLRRDDRFCCLGVACDLFSKQSKRNPQWEHLLGDYSFLGWCGTLDEKVLNWLGLTQKDQLELVHVNDFRSIKTSTNITFPEIASLIDELAEIQELPQ